MTFKIVTMVVFLLMNSAALACEVCKKQQPKVLQGIAHGAGPQSDWDYVIVWGMVLIVLVSLFYGIKWIIRPGEQGDEHIKRSIFN